MKLFVFGAGASLASQELSIAAQDPDDILRPTLTPAPLIDHLFNKIYVEIAEEVGLHRQDLETYRSRIEASGLSLEAWMTQEWDLIESMEDKGMQNAAYAQFDHFGVFIVAGADGVGQLLVALA